jgi:hypothetical protein
MLSAMSRLKVTKEVVEVRVVMAEATVVAPGDHVVLVFSEPLTDELADRMSDTFRVAWPDVKVAVVDVGGGSVAVAVAKAEA